MNEDIENIIWRYLNGTLDESERKSLLEWISQSHENERFFMSCYNSWSMLNNENINPHTSLTKMHTLLKKRGFEFKRKRSVYRSRIIIWSLSAAASILLLVGTFSLFHKVMNHNVVASLNEFSFSQINDSIEDEAFHLVCNGKRNIYFDGIKVNIAYDKDKFKVNDRYFDLCDGLNQLNVPNGKRAHLILADGTRIWVNSGTKIFFPGKFNRYKREIYVNGEAYLEVAHSLQKPFVVMTKQINVHVKGTKFNVCSYPQARTATVALLEGSVNVLRNGDMENDAESLIPNQLYSLNEKNVESISNVDAKRYISWVHDILICDDIPLQQLVFKLEHAYGIRIIINGNISSLRYTGKFNLKNNIEHIMNDIVQILPLKYKYSDDKTILLSVR